MLQRTNTNSVGDTNNRNSNIGRDRGRFRRDFGGLGGHVSQGDCRNNTLIAKSLFEGRLKDGAYLSSLSMKGHMEPHNSRKPMTFCQSYAQRRVKSIFTIKITTTKSWSKPHICRWYIRMF